MFGSSGWRFGQSWTLWLIPDADPQVMKVQRQKLNDLFGPYGMNPLAVDGVSGPLTRQQPCTARVSLGLPISRSDMAAGSPEEAELLALTSLPIPPGAPTNANHWARARRWRGRGLVRDR